jgi:hypothetical protein
MAPNFDHLFSEQPSGSVADSLTLWRILADMSSHATPQELAMIPRSGRLWELIEKNVEACPPTLYFANLVLSVYREQTHNAVQYNR